MIAFFDLFDYVLTDFEIWQRLSLKCELIEVIIVLENLTNKFPRPPLAKGDNNIENKNGFYFLAGQEKNVRVRLSRYNFTDRKFKRALLVSKIFKFIPWLKMIAIGNLLGDHNLKDDSDLDFFIVAEDKRIWLTRFFCAGTAKLLGFRPRANNSRDKICLSFYASGQAMDLSSLMINPLLNGADNTDDIYFIYWLAGLTPLYDVNGVYKKFMAANSWLKNYLPNWQPLQPSSRRQIKPFLWEFYYDLVDLFIGGLESQFKALQLKLLPPRLKNLMNQDSRVVVNNQIIKLHANDRRSEYREKYYRKIYEIFK